MSTSVAIQNVSKQGISLRKINNKMSTTYTKALTERDLVKKLVEGLLNGADAKNLGQKILNYVYRTSEYSSYKKIYGQVRLDTESGIKDIRAIEEFDAFVEDIKSHVSLNKCAKYDKPGQKHEKLDVFKLICLNRLETMNDDWSYSKASFKEKAFLIYEAINLLDDFYTQFDEIETIYEMGLEENSRIPMEAKMEQAQLKDFNTRKPSKRCVATHCEYTYSHDNYMKVRNFLLGVQEEVYKTYEPQILRPRQQEREYCR